MEPPDSGLVIMVGFVLMVAGRPLKVGSDPKSGLCKLLDVKEVAV